MSIVICQSQEDQIITKNQRNNTNGGLSFLQSMSDITTIARNREEETTKAYIHPVEKRSVSKLNEKSLEMCTESLGTETGSESGDELSLLALEVTATLPRVPSPEPEQKPKPNLLPKKSSNNSFPPPIKFVEGSKYNRMVRSYGEDGRLVVQAITVSSPPRCFVAERGEGRLRLCLSSESSLLSQNHEEEEEVEEEEEEEEEETEEGMEEELSESLEGKNGNKQFNRLSISSSRCKENGREAKPMLTWKQQQFWVAT